MTISRFDHRAAEASELSGSDLLMYYTPIVKESEREAWEQYSWENQGWIYDDWVFHKGEQYYEQNPGNISAKIYGFHEAIEILNHDPLWNETVKKAGWDSISQDLEISLDLGPPSPVVDGGRQFYAPIWQVGPVPKNASICNFDLYTKPAFKPVIDQALEVNHMLLSRVWALPIVTYFTTHGDVIVS